MGAKLAKVSCFRCLDRVKKKRKNAGNNERIEDQSKECNSEEILEQLRIEGIVKVENTTTATAGVAFDVVEPHDEIPARPPRRLPSLKRKNKVHPSGWYLECQITMTVEMIIKYEGKCIYFFIQTNCL